jgi:hypothetical protein
MCSTRSESRSQRGHQGWKEQGKPDPVPSPTWVLTFPGEGAQTHARVTQLDKWAGALRQPRASQQDVTATHVTMNQVLILLGWETRRGA